MTTVPQHQPPHQRQQQQHQYRQHAPPPQQQQQHYGLHAQLDTYDPDEVVPRDSPLMKALHPRLELSPSPPPEIPPGQVRPVCGDAVLVAYLDNGRHPEIAQEAGSQALPGADDDDDYYSDDSSSDDGPIGSTSYPDTLRRTGGGDGLPQAQDPMSATTVLQAVAVDALQAVAAEPSRHHVPHKPAADISVSTRQLSIHDDHIPSLVRHPRDAPLPGSRPKTTGGAMLTPGELPPLQMDSPKSESNGGQSLSLPSIRSTLGELAEPPTPVDRDLSTRHGGHGQAFPRSPVGIPRFSAMAAGSHVSPPISPNETYQRSLPSPHSLPASSPYYYAANGLHHRPGVEYPCNGSGDTPSTDQTISTPATTASVADRMSIDGITNPQIGNYACNVAGCMAPPFQTQYLLNSHANVHSSARPHYCPVPGCPRSEGGRGFKRKNEMIRHGLVHDSPGYVCPFCADREHKYPRPDNLQRHVRVHHVDKDKDDPRLRDVLSQRPDGPNRGRRRRGAPP